MAKNQKNGRLSKGAFKRAIKKTYLTPKKIKKQALSIKEKLEIDKENLMHKSEIIHLCPNIEKLYTNDNYFHKLVSEWKANYAYSQTKKSRCHTIRTLHTHIDNEKQHHIREKIILYAYEKEINTKETEMWLGMRF